MNQKVPLAPTESLGINLKPDICYFGTVHDRGLTKTFGILKSDRRRHMYILGKTGMGKTTLLTNMILQDIYNGSGVCFIDPHGDPAEYILDRIPTFRQNDVVYFNPADTDFPLGFNMLESKRGEEAFLVVSGMMAVFNRIWAGTWSARMEYILSNTLLALLETPGNTLLGVVRMLTDKDFRNKIIKNVQDPMVRNFWVKEFASFNDKYRTEAIAPVLNKIGQFFSTDLIRNILGQTKSTIDMREIMDKKKILIVNLSKGRLGEDNSELLGSLLVTKMQLAAMSRVDILEEERNDFYLYVDEFQNFTTDSFATILSEARKYRLNLILAHQYIAQLTETGNEKIKNAIFGNVGSIISFRVGADDAERLEREFEPVFTTQQLINLNATQIALKLSIEGKATDPFTANTLAPVFEKLGGRTEIVTALSRERYANSKDEVKGKIHRWLSEESGDEESSDSTPSTPRSESNTLSVSYKPRTTPSPTQASTKSAKVVTPTKQTNQEKNIAETTSNTTSDTTEKSKIKKKPNPFLSSTKDDRELDRQHHSTTQKNTPNTGDSIRLDLQNTAPTLDLNGKLNSLKQSHSSNVSQKVAHPNVSMRQTDGNMFELPKSN